MGSACLFVGGVLLAPATVLPELDALPIVHLVLAAGVVAPFAVAAGESDDGSLVGFRHLYSRIFVTRPAPTVLPPSRMAKRRPSSMAMGAIISTVISVLSPGITISVPSGVRMAPVTSVVRK